MENAAQELSSSEKWAAGQGAQILAGIEDLLPNAGSREILLALDYSYAFLVKLIVTNGFCEVPYLRYESQFKRCQCKLNSQIQGELQALISQTINNQSLESRIALGHYLRAARDLYDQRGRNGLPKTLKGLVGTAAIAGGLVILATWYVSKRKPKSEESKD